jgi:hypothetical protein
MRRGSSSMPAISERGFVRVCEDRAVGSFNATGPVNGTTVTDVLETCRTVVESEATMTWVDDEFLRERQVGE